MANTLRQMSSRAGRCRTTRSQASSPDDTNHCRHGPTPGMATQQHYVNRPSWHPPHPPGVGSPHPTRYPSLDRMPALSISISLSSLYPTLLFFSRFLSTDFMKPLVITWRGLLNVSLRLSTSRGLFLTLPIRDQRLLGTGIRKHNGCLFFLFLLSSGF